MKMQRVLTGLSLMKYGFIHVTGLVTSRERGENKRIEAHATDWGKTDRNNSMEVVVTLDGEVWLRHGSGEIRIWENEDFLKLLRTLCPNPGDVFVPCSNGEGIASYALFNRVSNPYWTGVSNEFAFKTPHANIESKVLHEDHVLA